MKIQSLVSVVCVFLSQDCLICFLFRIAYKYRYFFGKKQLMLSREISLYFKFSSICALAARFVSNHYKIRICFERKFKTNEVFSYKLLEVKNSTNRT